MVGVRTHWRKVQLSVTIEPEHAELIEKILKKDYEKPIFHDSASEVIRRALEHYAQFLGVRA